ncbi:MAG: dihydrodipicolinate synthase family protein [Deltaproteobacteria bacterium]|nr:dihydrodipicolinate synthase family protein [Deltaproteobacteria bacterium]
MKLQGILPPVITPFKGDAVAYDRLKENFDRWNKTSLSGYLVLGSNGEAVYLSEKEKLKIIEVSREAIPNHKIMLVGTGMESTLETIRFTNEAARLGADLALVVTPCYFKGSMTPEVLYDHFLAVAEKAQIPILVYNVPQFTGINLAPGLVARLSHHPNIIGVKDSSGNIEQLTRIVHESVDGFGVFVGSAPVLFPALCVGADGGILAVANALPELCTRLMDLFAEGNYPEALKLQNRLTPIATAVTGSYGIGGLKKVMDLRGYFGGEPRRPLKKITPEAEKDLTDLLQQLKDIL